MDIDWDAMETATDLFPPLYRLWASKHVSGFFGIGTMMKNWDFWDHSRALVVTMSAKTRFIFSPALTLQVMRHGRSPCWVWKLG